MVNYKIVTIRSRITQKGHRVIILLSVNRDEEEFGNMPEVRR